MKRFAWAITGIVQKMSGIKYTVPGIQELSILSPESNRTRNPTPNTPPHAAVNEGGSYDGLHEILWLFRESF